MIGYVVRERGSDIPPISVELFCYVYVYVTFASSIQDLTRFKNVYKVEFEPIGKLIRCIDGDAYRATRITILELV